MPLTFEIDGTNFVALSSAEARCALGIELPSERYDIQRFHPVGVEGSYTVDNGKEGGTLTARFRLRGTVEDVYTMYSFYRQLWASKPITIVAPDGSHPRCRLEPGGMRFSGKMQPTGRTPGVVIQDVEATFKVDS